MDSPETARISPIIITGKEFVTKQTMYPKRLSQPITMNDFRRPIFSPIKEKTETEIPPTVRMRKVALLAHISFSQDKFKK